MCSARRPVPPHKHSVCGMRAAYATAGRGFASRPALAYPDVSAVSCLVPAVLPCVDAHVYRAGGVPVAALEDGFSQRVPRVP